MEQVNRHPRAGPDRIRRLETLVRVSLGLNVLVLIATSVLAYVTFAIVLAEPARVEGVTDVNKPAQQEGDYRVELRDFFERMTRLLDRQARKHGVNPADVLPTQAEIDAAVETRTIHSDESQKVLQKLREGFDYFDMTWPIVIPER